MSLPVTFSPRALTNLEKMVEWAGQCSARASTNLLAALADRVRNIEQQPEMYPVSTQYTPLRRCVVTPTTALYYRIRPGAIEIVGIVDSRRDPDSLNLTSA
jgi:plasmid stabilization system protein ParE